MDSKSLLRAAQEPAFVLLDRVWYCCVVPVQPAGFVNKAQGFVLTSGALQEPCCALVALKLVAFLVFFGIRVFSALPRKSAPVCCVCVCDVKPTRRESCRMSLLSQDVCDYIPFLSHCWPPSGVTCHFAACHHPLCAVGSIQNRSVLFKSGRDRPCNFSFWRVQIHMMLH